MQRFFQTKDGIGSAVDGIAEKFVAIVFLLELRERVMPVGEDHVIHALEGVACHRRVGHHDVQIFPEGSFPMLFAKVGHIEFSIDDRKEWIVGFRHSYISENKRAKADARKFDRRM
jgi:hypothetical protein